MLNIICISEKSQPDRDNIPKYLCTLQQFGGGVYKAKRHHNSGRLGAPLIFCETDARMPKMPTSIKTTGEATATKNPNTHGSYRLHDGFNHFHMKKRGQKLFGYWKSNMIFVGSLCACVCFSPTGFLPEGLVNNPPQQTNNQWHMKSHQVVCQRTSQIEI